MMLYIDDNSVDMRLAVKDIAPASDAFQAQSAARRNGHTLAIRGLG